jgi:hypothetical protein
VLQSSLALLLEEGDLDPDLQFKTVNITKMITYILTQMLQAFEEKLTKKSCNGILIESGKVSAILKFLFRYPGSCVQSRF